MWKGEDPDKYLTHMFPWSVRPIVDFLVQQRPDKRRQKVSLMAC